MYNSVNTELQQTPSSNKGCGNTNSAARNNESAIGVVLPRVLRDGVSQRRGWLSRKVACSIPDGVFKILRRLNPSDLNTVLGSTQPLTEMSTRNLA